MGTSESIVSLLFLSGVVKPAVYKEAASCKTYILLSNHTRYLFIPEQGRGRESSWRNPEKGENQRKKVEKNKALRQRKSGVERLGNEDNRKNSRQEMTKQQQNPAIKRMCSNQFLEVEIINQTRKR